MIRRPYLTIGFCCLLPLLINDAWGYKPGSTDDSQKGYIDPALGIYSTFGRWETSVKLLYDPDGAPERFSDEDNFLKLLEEATGRWEEISGIDFEILGVDHDIVDDDGNPFQKDDDGNPVQDGLVPVYWMEDSGSVAGRGGPVISWIEEEGRYVLNDGSLLLNSAINYGETTPDSTLLRVLVHELGHVAGLGHSDKPQSVMYANPYNSYRYPLVDDVRVMQVIYGPPKPPYPPVSPDDYIPPEWIFTPPPFSSEELIGHIFTPFAAQGMASRFSIDGEPVDRIDDEIPDSAFLSFESATLGNTSQIDVKTKLVWVNPAGSLTGEGFYYDIPAGTAYSGVAIGIKVLTLKSQPGIWSVYMLDITNGEDQATTLLKMDLSVDVTQPAFVLNEAPIGVLSVVQGDTPDAAQFILTAKDPEEDEITAIWYPPHGSPWVLSVEDGVGKNVPTTFDVIEQEGSVSRTFGFSLTGTHQFFVELRDDSERYGNNFGPGTAAGPGYQTLMRVTLDLPITPDSGGIEVISTDDPQIRSAVAAEVLNNGDMLSAATTDGSASIAGFRLGASSDLGESLRTAFTRGTGTVVEGIVSPQPEDLGQEGEIFIVMRKKTSQGNSLTYLDADGIYRSWNGRLKDLQAAYRVPALKENGAFKIYQGTLPTGSYGIFMGYRLSDSGPLHYSSVPLKLDIQ